MRHVSPQSRYVSNLWTTDQSAGINQTLRLYLQQGMLDDFLMRDRRAQIKMCVVRSHPPHLFDAAHVDQSMYGWVAALLNIEEQIRPPGDDRGGAWSAYECRECLLHGFRLQIILPKAHRLY